MEDGSYGDFEYSDLEYDTYLDLATLRMFPAIYKRVSSAPLSLTAYGTRDYGSVTHADIMYDRVYLVEDADEYDAITGWTVRANTISGIDNVLYTNVVVHWTTAYDLPTNDVDDAGIPNIYEPLINLGALIEALESRQDTGVRGEPQPTGIFQETQLIDRLKPRYDALKSDLAMAMPGMRF